MTSEGINVPPPSFSGRSTDDAFAFVKEFERYVAWKNVTTDDRKRALFAVLMRDNAGAWYDTISDADKLVAKITATFMLISVEPPDKA